MPSLPFPQPDLGDGVVVLRPWRDEDASVKAAWGRDAAIVRWTGVPADHTEEAARARSAGAEERREAGLAVSLAVVDATSGAVCGSCDIWRPEADDPALGALGYLLAEHARGRGLATRAVGLVVEWSFRDLGMERVQALVHPDNPRSAGVLERLGFTREGLLRRCRPGDGNREDRILFAVLPDELVLPALRTAG